MDEPGLPAKWHERSRGCLFGIHAQARCHAKLLQFNQPIPTFMQQCMLERASLCSVTATTSARARLAQSLELRTEIYRGEIGKPVKAKWIQLWKYLLSLKMYVGYEDCYSTHKTQPLSQQDPIDATRSLQTTSSNAVSSRPLQRSSLLSPDPLRFISNKSIQRI